MHLTLFSAPTYLHAREELGNAELVKLALLVMLGKALRTFVNAVLGVRTWSCPQVRMGNGGATK